MVTKILDAISKGYDSKRKVRKHLSYVEEKVVNDQIKKAFEKDLIKSEKRFFRERLVLTEKGLEELSKLKVTEVHKRPSREEIVTDKIIGIILIVVGILLLYYALNMSLGLPKSFKSPKNFSSPGVESPGSIGASIQTAIANVVAPYFDRMVRVGLKTVVIFVMVLIGGRLLSNGVKLFKRA